VLVPHRLPAPGPKSVLESVICLTEIMEPQRCVQRAQKSLAVLTLDSEEAQKARTQPRDLTSGPAEQRRTGIRNCR
jgi:hypothetical protein